MRGPARVLAARWGDGHLALVTPRGAAHILTRPSPHCGAVFWKARETLFDGRSASDTFGTDDYGDPLHDAHTGMLGLQLRHPELDVMHSLMCSRSQHVSFS